MTTMVANICAFSAAAVGWKFTFNFLSQESKFRFIFKKNLGWTNFRTACLVRMISNIYVAYSVWLRKWILFWSFPFACNCNTGKLSSGNFLSYFPLQQVEKNELREEKLTLKADKERMEQQLKTLAIPAAGFVPGHPAAYHAGPNKMAVFPSYGLVPMWQYLPPSSRDTSHDHELRPPAA